MLCLFASVLFLIVSENKFVGAFLKEKENKGPDAMKRANLAWMESDSSHFGSPCQESAYLQYVSVKR